MSLGASFEGVSDEPFRVAEVVSEIAGTFADRSSGVAADHEVGLDVLDDGRAGVIVDLPELGRALVELLGDSARRERMREAGLARAREFALPSVVDRYEAIYRGEAPRSSY